jgi:hypothetical protein
MSIRRLFLFLAGASVAVCAACASVVVTGTPMAVSGSVSASSASPTTTAALDGSKVLSAVKESAQNASAVHVKGSMKDGDSGKSIAMDLQLNKDSASGSITEQGTTIPLLLVNGVYYLQFTDGVLNMAGLSPSSPGSALLRNKWVPSTSKLGMDMVEGFKELLNYDTFMKNVFGEIDQGTVPTGSDTIDGVAVLSFKDDEGAAADVTAATPHYLVRLVGPPAEPGTIDFSGWNQPVRVSAPPQSALYSGPGS